MELIKEFTIKFTKIFHGKDEDTLRHTANDWENKVSNDMTEYVEWQGDIDNSRFSSTTFIRGYERRG